MIGASVPGSAWAVQNGRRLQMLVMQDLFRRLRPEGAAPSQPRASRATQSRWRRPGLTGIDMAVESWIVHAIAGLPRPQQAASCFGLGRLAIGWWPVFSAEAMHGFITQGGVILA